MNAVKHITIFINRTSADVYAFASNPQNLPAWAAGLAQSQVSKQGDAWVAEAPFGKVRIGFAPANTLGVLDHDVQLESGVVVHNPMRVVPNGTGSEFTFTLFQQPGMPQQQFEEDAQAVAADLHSLKTLLESER
ncbi:SRPBCC family protein [Limnobacter alexandrii]|uniref:SRPBCC family protein n=1 Tax=Limnobacter alexandrii TaxID=2570352 RepID=UPI001109BED6|nr:SRPBCC family protein [Limnobacter alexandrii]